MRPPSPILHPARAGSIGSSRQRRRKPIGKRRTLNAELPTSNDAAHTFRYFSVRCSAFDVRRFSGRVDQGIAGGLNGRVPSVPGRWSPAVLRQSASLQRNGRHPRTKNHAAVFKNPQVGSFTPPAPAADSNKLGAVVLNSPRGSTNRVRSARGRFLPRPC